MRLKFKRKSRQFTLATGLAVALFAGNTALVDAQTDKPAQVASPSDVIVVPSQPTTSQTLPSLPATNGSLPATNGAFSVIESSKVFEGEAQSLPALPPVSDTYSDQVLDLPVAPAPASFPKPPASAGTFDRVIERLKENAKKQELDAVTAEPEPKPEIDISGDSIREEVRQRYDKEFNSDFPDDGWRDVDNAWSHKVGGRLLMDYVSWMDDAEYPGGLRDYFEIRQARLALSGRGYGQFEYKIQYDFEPEFSDTSGGTTVGTFGTVGMKDMFVGMRDVPIFGNIRLGHQKVNFSLSQMASRSNLTFAERPEMADPPGFTPGREVGISSLTQSADQNGTRGIGIYFDNISETSKERQNDNQGLVMGGRSTRLAYFDEPSDGRYLVHFGLGGVYRRPADGVVRFRARPSIHEGEQFIDTGAILSNEYRLYGGEFAVQGGPFTFQSEFMYASIDEFGPGQRQLWSYYGEASYRLTGEHRRYNRFVGIFDELVPYENFWLLPGSNGIGAWEVAARYSFTDFDDSPINADLETVSFALNWYLNPQLRMQMNYIHPVTEGGFVGNTESDALLLRMAAFF